MIIRFRFENVLSFKDEQELSLVSSALKDPVDGLLHLDALGRDTLLPAVLVYGANASGKSNLIAAFEFFRGAILSSFRADPDRDIPITPFRLEPDMASMPIRFVLDFIIGDVRYQYGFSVTRKEFVTEWLYSYPKGVRQVMFNRSQGKFQFGRALKGRNRVIAELTRKNSLFLSSAYQNNHDQLSDVARYLQSISIDSFTEFGAIYLSGMLENPKIDQKVIDVLSSLGTGVVSHKIGKIEESQEMVEFANAFQSALKKVIGESELFELMNRDRMKISLGHENSKGDIVYFELEDESSGTQRLLPMIAEILHTLGRGGVLIVDEFDANLHTQACEALLRLFCSKETNPKGAQLIATTHDTNLLGAGFLRRDQIWFIEKDQSGASDLFPLTDIHTRKGDNIEKGYLQGRFGAVPYRASFEELFE